MTEPNILGNRYELDEVVGRGGMAEVWRGRDVRLGRVVAVKMLRVDHSGDATFQARFRREAQSAASLNHHNIVAVYDTGEDMFNGSRIPYIVMEYVEGQTLREMVRDRARFTPERSIEVIIATLDALEYSHRAGIVHRDIKPGNIMITTAGEVKVMDFGIARSLADTGMALTQTAAVVGTAQYISPEQARGEQADARSDLYATGCVLYELLTGRPPFVGDSLVSVAVSHVREMAPPPSAIDPTIPRELDSIVMKSLAKDRRDRYQSAYEMEADLQRAQAGLPVAAAADVTSSTQLFGPSSQTAAYGAQQYADEPYDDYDDEEDEGKVPVWAVVLGTLAVLFLAGLIGYLVFRGDEAQQISVPNVVGETQEAAEELIEDEGLNPVVESRATDNADEFGIVLAQDPNPNTQLDEGADVTIIVGSSPENVTVPSVEGMTRSEAENELRNAGLEPAAEVETEETDDEDEAGNVVSTSPAIGESVAPGTTVTLTVYALPDSVTLTDLVGMTEDDAKDWLDENNLEYETENRDSAEDQGIVVETDPRGGSSLAPGDTVTLFISTGVTAVPNVLGRTENEAIQMITDAGFTPVQQFDAACENNNGQVYNQDPEPESELEPGGQITIWIARHDDSCTGGDEDGGDEWGNENGNENGGDQNGGDENGETGDTLGDLAGNN
jgi:serine/threonine-protein kinase